MSSASQAQLRPCASCGGDRRKQRFGDDLPWVVECVDCGLVFADPQPTDEELESIYDDHYFEQFGFVEGPHSLKGGLARTKRETYMRMLKIAMQEIRSDQRRLLDLGCGIGFSLTAAHDAGFSAIGLDPLAPADPNARPGRRILRGTLETFTGPERFDVVSLIDVIEHVRDPRSTVSMAAKLLEPGGVLLIATNDSSSRGARMLGSRWPHYHRAHLYFFTPDTLSAIVRNAGLTILRCEPAHRVYNLEYIASILSRGTNFELAAKVSKFLLRVTPEPLARMPWPPLVEGFVLIARPSP